MSARAAFLLSGSLAAIVSCAGGSRDARVHAPPVRVAGSDPAARDDGTYWQETPLSLSPGERGAVVPLESASLEVSPATAARFGALSDERKRQVFASGVLAVARKKAPSSLGAYYLELDESRAPYVVTFDALFSLVRACVGASFADAENLVVRPALATLLDRLGTRLGAEASGARVDLFAAYEIARGIVAVAHALLDPNADVPAELKPAVSEELSRIRVHTGPAESRVLGRPIDYATFDAEQGLVDDDVRLGAFRATRWLSHAALVLAGDRIPARVLDVAEMRSQTRAALLLARAISLDPAAAKAAERLRDVLAFMYGPGDDLGVRELWRAAKNAGVDPADGQALGSVVSVDRVRRAVAGEATPQVFDLGPFPIPPSGQAPITFRVLGLAATPDAIVLGKLTWPAVGPLVSTTQPFTSHDGHRALPTALDVGVLFGAAEARDALAESGDDAYAGFATALEAATKRRWPEDGASKHASVVLSYLDAIATYARPSLADATQPASVSKAFARRKLAVTLAAWAELRHETSPFSHEALAPTLDTPPGPDDPRAVAVVEPHPEAIARLASLVSQVERGLSARSAFGYDSPAKQALVEMRALLEDALAYAVAETAGAPAPKPVAWPKRLASIEARLGVRGGVPRVTSVHEDAGGRALEEATGALADVFMVLRAADGSPRAELYVGAGVPHYEIATTLRLTDRAWQKRLSETPTPLPTYAAGFASDE